MKDFIKIYSGDEMNKINIQLIMLFISLLCISCNYKTNETPPPVLKTNNSNTITIGTQVWMTTNLDVDHYRNGEAIPQASDQWLNLRTGAWCYYNNDSATGTVYGKLYNWYAVNDPRGLAPAGWHIPSDKEWTILITYLGGESIAGGKLKEAGTIYWESPNSGATNESGFSALPGGFRYTNGTFINLRVNGNWWTSTEGEPFYAYCRYASFESAISVRSPGYKNSAFSVRCIRN